MTPGREDADDAKTSVPGSVSEAAHASSETTAGKIEEAAEVNEDPKVGQVLEEASIHADATVRRVGWLRDWFRRVIKGSGAQK
jgi:hypothetical protein